MRFNAPYSLSEPIVFDDWPSNTKLCFHIVNNLVNVLGQSGIVGGERCLIAPMLESVATHF